MTLRKNSPVYLVVTPTTPVLKRGRLRQSQRSSHSFLAPTAYGDAEPLHPIVSRSGTLTQWKAFTHRTIIASPNRASLNPGSNFRRTPKVGVAAPRVGSDLWISSLCWVSGAAIEAAQGLLSRTPHAGGYPRRPTADSVIRCPN